MADQTSITGLSDGLKEIAKGADLKLSKAVAEQYLARLTDYRNTLNEALKQTEHLELDSNGGGSLASAQKTIFNLNVDVTDLAGIRSVITKYIDYLDELEKTVRKSCAQLINSG
jgi:hypothetical protein